MKKKIKTLYDRHFRDFHFVNDDFIKSCELSDP